MTRWPRCIFKENGEASIATIDDVVNDAQEDNVEIRKLTDVVDVVDVASSDDKFVFDDSLTDAIKNLPKNYKTNLCSQMITSALFRSTTFETSKNGSDCSLHQLRWMKI